MTNQEAIEGFKVDNALLGDCEPGVIERNNIAIAALKEKISRDNPQPLTLDEVLKKAAKGENTGIEIKFLGSLAGATNVLGTSLYGKTWLAYDYQPKEG